jgi:3-deoxy-7-phosphoheptulonate synthase
MHANTFTAPSGHKTRAFADIVSELSSYFAVHRSLGTWPGGIHVELTGSDVTECVGGETEIHQDALDENYLTICDPRLNPRQALDLAFTAADLLR